MNFVSLICFYLAATGVVGAADLKLKPGQQDVVTRLPNGPLDYRIDNQFGAVDIELVDSGPIEVLAKNQANGSARIDVGGEGIHVRVKPPRSGRRSAGSINLHVRLPSRLLRNLNVRAFGTVRAEDLLPGAVMPMRNVRLISIDGDVSLRQHVLLGKFHLRNAQGELRLSEVNPPSVQMQDWALIHLSRRTATLEAHRTSGDLDVTALALNGAHIERHRGGPLFVSAEAGKVLVDSTSAWTTLRTLSGPIYARENRGRLIAVSDSGALELFGHRKGAVEFRGQTGAIVAIDNHANLDLNTRGGAVRVVDTGGDLRVWAPDGPHIDVRDQIWGAIDVYTDSADVHLHNPRALREDVSSVSGRVKLTWCTDALVKPRAPGRSTPAPGARAGPAR